MSGNHYSKQVIQLEDILSSRIAQLAVLETENALLKQKEQALQSCIQGIEGSVAATRAMLELEAHLESAAGTATTSRSAGAGCADSASGDLLGAAGTSGCEQTISAASSAATQAVLQALEAKEQQAQAALAQLGCCSSSSGGSYDELYSTRLLRRATADPAAALAIVRFPGSERLQCLVTAVQRMAVLLRKYDSPGPTTSLGSAQEQLHAVVDALSERVIVAGLLDPPAKKLGNMLVNLETLEPEPYPQGYWRAVARNMQLTADQKAAFKLCWASVKANKAALTEQHSRLSARLETLQLQQQQVQLEFEMQAAHLQDLQRPYSVKQARRTKEALLLQQQQQQQQQARASQQQQGTQDGSPCHALQQGPAVSTPQPGVAVPWRQPWTPPEGQQQHAQGQCHLLTGTLKADAQPFARLAEQHKAEQHKAEQQQQQQQQQRVYVPVITGVHRPAVRFELQQLHEAQASTSSGSAAALSRELSADATVPAETSRGSFNSAVSNPEAMLLPASCKEQRGIEQQLDVIIEKLKMQHFCMFLQFYNVLTYKQLAGTYVDAWPFVPDAFSVCEAMDELDWQ